MEVYAAYLAYTDHEIGRVVQAVEDMGKLDNTLIIYISGDNGGSAEGSPAGTPNEMTFFNGVEVPVADQMKFYDAWGSQLTYPHMAVGWTWAMSTPYKWTKQIPSYFGGIRNGMAIAWPGHIKDAGGIRNQFHHVIDIVPTILEVTGIRAPEQVDGITQNADRGGEPGLHLRQGQRRRALDAQDPVFRDVRQSGALSRRLDRLDGALPGTVERHRSDAEGRGERRQVGAVRSHQGLDSEQ